MKIGRNDPCICGSGKKFKHCCSGKDVEPQTDFIIPPAPYQLIIEKYFFENHINVRAELEQFEKVLFEKSVNINVLPLDSLREYIINTEKDIENIVSKYNTYELLYWSRRLAPMNLFGSSDLTVLLYREVQRLGFYKYGKVEEQISISNPNSVQPIYMEKYVSMKYEDIVDELTESTLSKEIINVFTDVIRTEILSYLFVKSTQLYRIASKGGEIKFDMEKTSISVFVNPELKYLIDLYDERLTHINLFSKSGAFVDEKLSNEKKIFCPFFQINVDLKKSVPLYLPDTKEYNILFPGKSGKEEIRSNYQLGGINIKNIYSHLLLFEDEFKEYYQFGVLEFALLLAYLGYKIFDSFTNSFNAQYQLLNRAYSVGEIDFDEIESEFNRLSKSLYKNVFDSECHEELDIKKVLIRFFYYGENLQEIDLWTRGPIYLFYPISKKHLVLDYSGLVDIVSYVTKEITQKDGPTGNKRALSFEQALNDEIIKVFGNDAIWISRSTIKAGQSQKEIDASFIFNDILFILEAKAVNISFAFDKGDAKAMEFRKQKMISALREVDAKALFVEKHKENLSKKIPPNVRIVCPIVISSYPEYIWEKSDSLFVSEQHKLPRILTISEIEKIKLISESVLNVKKWALKLE